MAISFLLSNLGIGWVLLTLRKYSKVMHYVEAVMGVILMIVNAMLFLGIFNLLSRYGFFVGLGL